MLISILVSRPIAMPPLLSLFDMKKFVSLVLSSGSIISKLFELPVAEILSDSSLFLYFPTKISRFIQARRDQSSFEIKMFVLGLVLRAEEARLH